MPQPRFDRYDEIIATLAAVFPKHTDVWREFRKLAAEKGWHDIPGQRTVERRCDEFRRLNPEVLGEQAPVRWPESFGTAELPWEASRTVLDLVHWSEKKGLEPVTVRLAKWFWRLYIAAPTMPTDRADFYAGGLASVEFARETGLSVDYRDRLPGLQRELASKDWGGAAVATKQGGPQ